MENRSQPNYEEWKGLNYLCPLLPTLCSQPNYEEWKVFKHNFELGIKMESSQPNYEEWKDILDCKPPWQSLARSQPNYEEWKVFQQEKLQQACEEFPA